MISYVEGRLRIDSLGVDTGLVGELAELSVC